MFRVGEHHVGDKCAPPHSVGEMMPVLRGESFHGWAMKCVRVESLAESVLVGVGSTTRCFTATLFEQLEQFLGLVAGFDREIEGMSTASSASPVRVFYISA